MDSVVFIHTVIEGRAQMGQPNHRLSQQHVSPVCPCAWQSADDQILHFLKNAEVLYYFLAGVCRCEWRIGAD